MPHAKGLLPTIGGEFPVKVGVRMLFRMAQKGGGEVDAIEPLRHGVSMTCHVKDGWHEVPESRRFIGRFSSRYVAGPTGNHGDANAPFVDTSLEALEDTG